MTIMRQISGLVAIPIAVVALSGAASPTTTYHGVFDDTAELSTTCPAMFQSEGWSGVWNLQLKDDKVGAPVMVQLNLKYNGTPHAVFRAAFKTVTPDSDLVLKAEQHPAPGDDGYVSLGEDGEFTYTRDLNFPGFMVCKATFTGHLTN